MRRVWTMKLDSSLFERLFFALLVNNFFPLPCSSLSREKESLQYLSSLDLRTHRYPSLDVSKSTILLLPFRLLCPGEREQVQKKAIGAALEH